MIEKSSSNATNSSLVENENDNLVKNKLNSNNLDQVLNTRSINKNQIKSKALQKANEHRAKIVTFYLNGEPFSNHFKVSILSNLQNFYKLLDYLTERAKIPIWYLFTIEGKRITSLDQLVHNGTYVYSTSKKFYSTKYGKMNDVSNLFKPFNKSKPFPRPISSKNKYNIQDFNQKLKSLSNETEKNDQKINFLKPSKVNNLSNYLPNNDRIVNILNKKLPNKSSKVFLNLKSVRTFENLVKNLGESVLLSDANVLVTPNGKVIQNLSQLKLNVNKFDTFYVDSLKQSFENLQKKTNETNSKFNFSDNSANDENSKQGDYINQFLSNTDFVKKDDQLICINNNLKNLENSIHSNNQKKENQNFLFDNTINEINLDNKYEKNESYNEINIITDKDNKHNADSHNKYNEKNKEQNNILNRKSSINKIDSDSNSNNSEYNEDSENNEENIGIKSIKSNNILIDNNFDKINKENEYDNVFKDFTEEENIKDEIKEENEINYNENNLTNEINQNKIFLNDQKEVEKTIILNNKSLIPKPKFNLDKLKDTSDSNYKDFESHLVNGSKIPREKFVLKRIFGYNGNTTINNLFVLPSGELAYFISLFVVFRDSINKQKFYFDHTEDICCISIDYSNNCFATGQKAFYTPERNNLPIVNVWNYTTLKTIFTINEFDVGSILLSLDFSKLGFLAIIALKDNNIQIYYWDWKNNSLIAKENKLLKNEEIYGIVFHPNDEKLLLTYGKHHLSMWKLEDRKLVIKKSLKKDFTKKKFTINRLSFLFNQHMIITDSNGLIIIWNDNCLKVNETKAHDASISSLLIFPNNYIVTGDVLGVLKTWSYEKNKLNLLNIAVLPTLSGSINSLIFTNSILLKDVDYFLNNVDDDKLYQIYIGTSKNMIFYGSALQATQYYILFESHLLGVRAIAADSSEKYFYTSSIDQKICKWNKNLLIWCVNGKYPSVSMAVYPTGETLAVGCTNGVICILNTISGELLNQINLSDCAIGCLGYSPDSLLLAAGTQNGVLHILPIYKNGTSYDNISALKCNYPILTLQWSFDCKYILTSVNEDEYQELILWDISTSKSMKGVSVKTEKNYWYNATCIFGDDLRGVWDNINLENVINLCCRVSPSEEYVVTGDDNGFIRLFSYPCTDKNASFYMCKQSSSAVTEVCFLKKSNIIISSNLDGAIFIWETIS